MTDRQALHAMLAACYGGPGMALLLLGEWGYAVPLLAAACGVVWVGERKA